jgi:hypothetical protein
MNLYCEYEGCATARPPFQTTLPPGMVSPHFVLEVLSPEILLQDNFDFDNFSEVLFDCPMLETFAQDFVCLLLAEARKSSDLGQTQKCSSLLALTRRLLAAPSCCESKYIRCLEHVAATDAFGTKKTGFDNRSFWQIVFEGFRKSPHDAAITLGRNFSTALGDADENHFLAVLHIFFVAGGQKTFIDAKFSANVVLGDRAPDASDSAAVCLANLGADFKAFQERFQECKYQMPGAPYDFGVFCSILRSLGQYHYLDLLLAYVPSHLREERTLLYFVTWAECGEMMDRIQPVVVRNIIWQYLDLKPPMVGRKPTPKQERQ